MCDEDEGEIKFLAQFTEQVEHLCLDRHIQRRDRFIGHDQSRVQAQGPCQSDALPLSAREFVGIALHVVRIQADLSHEMPNTIIQFTALGHLMDNQRLADDVAYGHARVERTERVLENHAHFTAQQFHLLLVDLGHVDNGPVRLAVQDFAVGGIVEAQNRATGCRFAATALTHQAPVPRLCAAQRLPRPLP